VPARPDRHLVGDSEDDPQATPAIVEPISKTPSSDTVIQ
jgi:hypothetical protein